MFQLFFGYLLVLFNVTVTIKGYSFDVLLDFIGYILIVRAAVQLSAESEIFKKTVLPSKIMVGLTAVSGLVFGISALGELPYLGTVKSLVLLVIQLAMLAVLYYQIKGLGEIENSTGYYMKVFKLRSDWMLLAVACVLTSVSIYSMIMTVANYAKLLFSVLFLLDLNTVIKGYSQQLERPADAPIPGQRPKRGRKGGSDSAAPTGEDAEISYTAEESESEEDQ